MMKPAKFFFLSLLGILTAFPALGSALLSQVEVRVAEQREQVVLYVDKVLIYKHFMLENPPRLVVDTPSLRSSTRIGLPEGYNGTLIRDIRFGQFNATTSRLVIDLAAPARLTRAFTLKQPNRIVIELAAAEAGDTAQAEEKPKTAKGKKEEAKPLIVIDAGHGGVDPGALSADGRFEKNITLEYARALRDALLKTGAYRVNLTRADDRFIILRERVRIARKADADLFISVHADSAPNEEARGLSVHTLSEVASDKEAEALAAQENKVDLIYGLDLSKENSEVTDILIDLAQRETRNKSSELAEELVRRLGQKVTLLPRAHRFAGFAVLKAPDIPSVLVELGFLTNTQDSTLLGTRRHKDKVTAGMVQAIDAYFRKHPTQ